MGKPTLATLMDFHVVAVLKKLKKWMKPLQEIVEEVHVFSEPTNIILVAENGDRMRFDKAAINAGRKAFSGAEWYLTTPCKKDGVEGLSLLIGVLPKSHYLTIAPKKEKRLDGKVEK